MIDWQLFGSTLRWRRKGRSLRDMAEVLKTNISNLSRIENGHACEADLFMTICVWLGTPAERFLVGAAGKPISADILADDYRLDQTEASHV